MPRRPRRQRPAATVERDLDAELFAGLRRLCLLLHISPGGWQRTPLGPGFETAAAVLVRERLRARGQSLEDAERAAANSVGLSPGTIDTRLQRWYRDSRTAPPADCHYEPCAAPAVARSFPVTGGETMPDDLLGDVFKLEARAAELKADIPAAREHEARLNRLIARGVTAAEDVTQLRAERREVRETIEDLFLAIRDIEERTEALRADVATAVRPNRTRTQ